MYNGDETIMRNLVPKSLEMNLSSTLKSVVKWLEENNTMLIALSILVLSLLVGVSSVGVFHESIDDPYVIIPLLMSIVGLICILLVIKRREDLVGVSISTGIIISLFLVQILRPDDLKSSMVYTLLGIGLIVMLLSEQRILFYSSILLIGYTIIAIWLGSILNYTWNEILRQLSTIILPGITIVIIVGGTKLALQRSNLQKDFLIVQLEQAKEHIQKLYNDLKKFIDKVNHDLQTPVDGFLGNLGLFERYANSIKLESFLVSREGLLNGISEDIRKRVDPADLDLILESFLESNRSFVSLELQKMKENLQLRISDLRATAKNMSQQVGDLLNTSRVQNGKIQISSKKVNISNIIHDLEVMFTPESQRKQLKLSFINEVHSEIFVDSSQLRRMAMNLLSNALKNTSIGNVSATFYEEDDDLCIKVEDSGVGIKPEDLKRIGESFLSIEGSSSEGVGLGLATTKATLNAINGKLTVMSEIGKGSVFTIKAPLNWQLWDTSTEKK